MIWLTWRQFRTHAWVALAALVALAAAYAVTGPDLAHLYADSGLAHCQTNCGSLANSFLDHVHSGPADKLYNLGIGVLFVVPAIVGVFWGAPLVARELEAGTYRLAWNQSVTRTRWLAVKLVGGGLATMAAAGLLSLAVTWWASPIDAVSQNRILPQVFAARGVVPIGYAAFAFALGVTAGVLIRRTVPAMAVTLALVVAAQVAMPLWVRAQLLPPVHGGKPLDVANLSGFGIDNHTHTMVVEAWASQPGAWVLSNQVVASTGRPYAGPINAQACNRDASPKACMDWVASLHLQQVLTYQPGSRFWPLQWYETGLFLAAALVLAGCCFWLIRPRRT